MLRDLREGGTIEQDADSVTFVFIPSRYSMKKDGAPIPEDIAMLYLRKQRDGELGDVVLRFEASTTTFHCSRDLPPVQRTNPVQTSFPEQMR